MITVKTMYTIISPGTELSLKCGNEKKGYSAVGIITKTTGTLFQVGDRVFCRGQHKPFNTFKENCVIRIPDSLSFEKALFHRFIEITMRCIELVQGEDVTTILVSGLGLIGHVIVKMLLYFTNCKIIIKDLIKQRLTFFQNNYRVSVDTNDLVDVAIDCSGSKNAIKDDISALKPQGKLIFAGFFWNLKGKIFHECFDTIMTKKLDITWNLTDNKTHNFKKVLAQLKRLKKFNKSQINVASMSPPSHDDGTYDILLSLSKKNITTVSGWENWENLTNKSYMELLETIPINNSMYETMRFDRLDVAYKELENRKQLTYIIDWS